MHLKVIRTELEHQQALSALLKLMDDNPAEGTNEADQLDMLALLIERYEETTFPIDLPLTCKRYESGV